MVPTRNRLPLLRRALASALMQDGPSIEVIVVDDGCTDGTGEWLAGLLDARLRVLRNPVPHGVSHARNKGVKAARGEWVAFLDDDDFWAPTYLAQQVKHGRAAGAGMVAASAIFVDEDGKPLYFLRAPVNKPDLARALFTTNVFGGPSRVIARRDSVLDVGGFDPQLDVMADWDLWLTLIQSQRAASTVDVLVAITEHEDNMQLLQVDEIFTEIDYVRTKHTAFAAAIGATFGSAERSRWVAKQYRRAGRRWRAARVYLAVSREYRSPLDALRGVAVLFGERVLSLLGRKQRVEDVPDWLIAASGFPPNAESHQQGSVTGPMQVGWDEHPVLDDREMKPGRPADDRIGVYAVLSVGPPMAASVKSSILRSLSTVRRQWRMRRPSSAGRSRAMAEELEFWREWFATRGLEWPDEYARRTDFTAEVEDPVLRGVLAELPRERIEILDVGAGPTTVVGYRFPGKDLAITAVDPLADDYIRVLREAGIDPPIQPQPLRGEDLLQRFGPGTFDIAFSRNALDHAVDPVPIIENMLHVLRPGGFAVLRHVPNEAVTEDYRQLHQWNFDERDGHCIVWRNPRHERDLNELLADRAEVSCHRDLYDGYEWICCILRKRKFG